jgi:hypothetical protein
MDREAVLCCAKRRPSIGKAFKSWFDPSGFNLEGLVRNFQLHGRKAKRCMGCFCPFESPLMDHRKPLPWVADLQQPRRLNIVMTGLGKGLTGGPLSILQFAAEVVKAGRLGVRWINVDGKGISGSELLAHLTNYEDLNVLTTNTLPFVIDAPNKDVILTHPDDLCMATIYFTAQICHATTRLPDFTQKNFLYFVQDYEPIFFSHNSRYYEAVESYTLPHFAIYSTTFLQKHFVTARVGPYGYMPLHQADAAVYASEPAIAPWGTTLNIRPLLRKGRIRRLFVYARAHADRNAYDLTLAVLSKAICTGAFTPLESWEFIGLGARFDENMTLGGDCNHPTNLAIRQNIPRPLYRRLVRSGDVGFSLMMSPHPSLPPFDYAAAGLIAVTNSFWTKTREMFLNVSTNFEIAPLSFAALVKALHTATRRALDYRARKRGADMMHWESRWNGDRCYGPTLMKLLEKWYEQRAPLWPLPEW